MYNHVGLLGFIAEEIAVRYAKGGVPYAYFDLAVKAPAAGRNAPPDYIPIVCWRGKALFCARYLSRGRQVLIEGKLTTRKWKDKKTGRKRKRLEVIASAIYFADGKGSAEGVSCPEAIHSGVNARQQGETGRSMDFMEIPAGTGDYMPFV